MTHAYLITSAIELDPSKTFKGARQRTAFTPQQRLEQTKATLLNMHRLDPSAWIYFVDSSVTFYPELLSLGIPNLTYVQLQNLDPHIAQIVRTHSSKSHCECLMLVEFFKHYKQELKQFDFITKTCGRYTVNDNFNTSLFTAENKNKYFFKKEMAWSGPHIDFLTEQQLPHDMLVDGTLHGLYTVLHSLGNQKLDQYEALMTSCAQASQEYSKYYHQDVEYTLHMYLRIFGQLDDIIFVDWSVDGQCGATGNWMRY
jgi:hypothetical protein